MTVQELIDQFLRNSSIRSQRTGTTYATALNRFLDYLAQNSVKPGDEAGTLTLDHARDYTAWLAHDYRTQDGTKLTFSSLSLYLTTLLLFYDYLIIDGIISSSESYVKLRRWIRDHLKGQPRPPIEKKLPPPELVEALLEAADIPPVMDEDLHPGIKRRRRLAWLRDRAAIYCLESSGMRVGELAGLRRGDLQPDSREAWVTGKGKKERLVFFSSDAWGRLTEYLDARQDRGSVDRYPLFCRHDRGAGARILPISTLTIERTVQRLCLEHGIAERFNLTPHSLRHFFATRFLAATGDLALTQDALGHADPSTTRIYAQTNRERMREEHTKLFG